MIDRHLITQTIFRVAAPSATPPLSSPLSQTALFTDSAEQPQFICVCDPQLCLHVHRGCVYICVCVHAHAADTRRINVVRLRLWQRFGGHICGFTSLLRLQDFEAESGE